MKTAIVLCKPCFATIALGVNDEDNLALIRFIDEYLVQVLLPRPQLVAFNYNRGLVVTTPPSPL